MKCDDPMPTPRFRELVRLLLEEELTRAERRELKRALRKSDEARQYLAEVLADSTLDTVRSRRLDRDSVRLSS